MYGPELVELRTIHLRRPGCLSLRFETTLTHVEPSYSRTSSAMKTNWFRRQTVKWKRDVTFVLWQARTLTLLLKHPMTPWPAKLVAGCTAAYLLSPIQLIPTFIPVIGQMDDLFVLFTATEADTKLHSFGMRIACSTVGV
jgi:uncharacterized membrane protein YkvA (DUF1232 family)